MSSVLNDFHTIVIQIGSAALLALVIVRLCCEEIRKMRRNERLDAATKFKSGWVVCERQNGAFVQLSKPFKTKGQAEKERKKLHEKYPKAAIGVGFVRVAT